MTQNYNVVYIEIIFPPKNLFIDQSLPVINGNAVFSGFLFPLATTFLDVTMLTQLSFFKPQFIAPIVVITLLIYFIWQYIYRYHAPARILQKMMRQAALQVELTNKKIVMEQRSALSDIFNKTDLEHSWFEFEKTLHDQNEIRDGENHVFRIRATAPSSYFFSAQKIIETPLQTEYFKHLPGILTGIGIIGTFAGLMLGLYHFDPSDPTKVQESVSNLLNDVLYAFAGSMCSIVVAMVITNSEKNNLRLCIESLEKLTDTIDRIFDAGVNEEYLAELVRHTQESSTQTRMLKDSLVTDLREMLQNLVDTQVKENLKLAETLSISYKDSGRDIATQISDSIEASFREPLNQLAKSVQTATGDQSGKVQTLLQDVLVAFMQKLDGTFGSQFSGMQEMLQQSITSMQQMQSMFSSLVQDMRSASVSSGQILQEQLAKTLADMHSNQSVMQASMNEMVSSLQVAVANIGSQGEQAGSRMGDQIEKIFSESEARQQAMADQMQSFIDGLKESVGKGQHDTMQRISDTVDQLGSHLGVVLQNFETNRHAMDDASEKAYLVQQEQMNRSLADMHDNQSTMQNTMSEMLTSLQNTVISIGDQGEQAGALIGKQLEKQYSNNAERQQLMAGQLDNFVSNIQENITNGQSDAMRKIGSTVEELGGILNIMMTTFEKNRHAMDGASEKSSIAQQEQMSMALAGIHNSQATMHDTMNEMVASLQNSVISIGEHGEQAGTRIGKELEKQYNDNTERQQLMIEKLDNFIENIQKNVANGQNDAMKKIAATVGELGEKLNSIVATFEKNRQAMDTQSIAAQQQLQANTKALLDELSMQVKSLLISLQQGHDATRQTIKLLGDQTERNLAGLQLGADKINAAASEFTVAGQGIVQITNSSANLAAQIQGSAGELGVASKELNNVLDDYRSQRDAFQETVRVIETIVANAQAEGGMRGQVLLDLKNVSDRMQILNQEATDYLDQITGVLGKSFDSFGSGVEKSLSRTLASFDAELDTAIKALGGGVQELSENLETFGEMVEKSTRLHKVA